MCRRRAGEEPGVGILHVVYVMCRGAVLSSPGPRVPPTGHGADGPPRNAHSLPHITGHHLWAEGTQSKPRGRWLLGTEHCARACPLLPQVGSGLLLLSTPQMVGRTPNCPTNEREKKGDLQAPSPLANY